MYQYQILPKTFGFWDLGFESVLGSFGFGFGIWVSILPSNYDID
jgi:hypothetical protein